MVTLQHKKSPYWRLCMLVLVVVDMMVCSSTVRDFHENSFWQHHCDGTRKLYTNSGVHTVRSQKFHLQANPYGSLQRKRKVLFDSFSYVHRRQAPYASNRNDY